MARIEGRLTLERRPVEGRRPCSLLSGLEHQFDTRTLDEAQRFADNLERAVARYWQTHPRPRPENNRWPGDRRGGRRNG